MRLFLAIPLSDAVRGAVAEMQARLRATGAGVRWVEPDNFHITVKFIGDRPDELLPELEGVCGAVAAQTDAFEISVRGAGAFPKRGPLKTLWAGLSEGAEAWKALARRAEGPLAAYGVAREGGLVPHITLGRAKSPEGMDDLRAALDTEARTDCGRQSADRIALVQSTLDPRGAIYKTLREWPLLRKEP